MTLTTASAPPSSREWAVMNCEVWVWPWTKPPTMTAEQLASDIFADASVTTWATTSFLSFIAFPRRR